MGLLRRGRDPERDLARALAKDGVAATGVVRTVLDTGGSRGRGSREVEMALEFPDENGTKVAVTVRQHMTDAALTGLSPGEPVSIMYVRSAPERVAVLGSPRFVIIDGAAVPVAGSPPPGADVPPAGGTR